MIMFLTNLLDMASESSPDSSPNLTLIYRMITWLALINNGYLLIQMPSPGAVWPAMVMYGLVIFKLLFRIIVPEILNTTVLGPDASTAARKLPGPESFKFVTS